MMLAVAYPDLPFVQQTVGQICWDHNIALIERRAWRKDEPHPLRYVTKLVEKFPKELADALPSVEQIEAALANGGNDGK